MQYVVCKRGLTEPGTATVTLERDGLVLVVKHVPAQVCAVCGEEYVDEDAASNLLAQAEAAPARGVSVEVRDYAALGEELKAEGRL